MKISSRTPAAAVKNKSVYLKASLFPKNLLVAEVIFRYTTLLPRVSLFRNAAELYDEMGQHSNRSMRLDQTRPNLERWKDWGHALHVWRSRQTRRN